MRLKAWAGLAVIFAAFAGTLALAKSERALSQAELQRAQVQKQLRSLDGTPGQLFVAQPISTAERQQEVEARVKRARVVGVDQSYVQQILSATPLALETNSDIAPGSRFQTLNLFDDLSVDVVKISESRSDLGLIVWRGTVVGDPMGSVTMVIANGEITGRVVTQGREVTIFPAGGGLHKVREVGATSAEFLNPDRRKTDDARPTPPPTAEELSGPPPSTRERAQADPTYTVRVLVAYTPKAATDIPGMAAAISLAIADINTTFTNSQISAQAQLVGLERVNYTEGSNTDNKILDDASDSVGDFARITQMRSVMQADLVAVIASYDVNSSCGLGWINDTLDQVTGSLTSRVRLGTSLTNSAGACLPGTFTHEVGHNMGAHHDRFVVTDAVDGPTGYNYGYVDTTAKFMDVMAYDDQCKSLSITCTSIQYYSNPSVNYNGRPVGIADTLPKAANNARKIREVLPNIVRLRSFLATPTTPMLAVLVTGSGTVSSSVSGISNCGSTAGTCAATYSASPSVTLTPTAPSGYQFTGWSGACTGSGTCTVSMSTSRSVTASFAPSLRIATVYSSAQSDNQSFLRFANTSSTASNVSVILADAATGASLATWSSPSIAAGTALQVPITTVESALPAGTAKPQFYAASVQSDMTGYIQHVLYRPNALTFTNLSTCDSGVTANTGQLANVHSTILDYGFPSSIAITNTGTSASTVKLGIFDSTNGVRLGTYTSSSIPVNGQATIAIATIQSAAGISPTSTMYHYTLKIENSFTGTLQHLVNNISNNKVITTDMTTACAFGTVSSPASTLALRQPGPIFSSTQSSSQSFLRFFNTGTAAGTVNVAMYNSSTGTSLGSWTSPSIPAGSSKQFPITTVESAITGNVAKPANYATTIQTQITGFFQHVLYRPADGTLTNLSTCDAAVTSSPSQLINVHSSVLDFGFPSSVVVSNPGSTATTVTLGIFDSENGTRVGTYTTPSIPAGGRSIIAISTIQNAIGYTPASDFYHYVIKAEGTFNGFLQHLVTNTNVGVVTDMTTMCALPARAVSYTRCDINSCSMAVGTPVTGQLRRPGGFEQYTVNLTAGRTYTFEVKGASSNNGTLTKPYLYVSNPSFTTVAEGGSGGVGNDIKITYTPTVTGSYFFQVTAYIYDNNGGTFVLSVN